MKRYWKLLGLLLIIILTISTFYIQSSLAINKFPQFTIEHIKGDSEELKNLTILGYYMDDLKGAAHLEIDQNGTEYDKAQSYLDLLSVTDAPHEIIDLQRRYRSFMRDKQGKVDGFFENDEMLIYANINTKYNHVYGMSNHKFTLEIESLSKETKDKHKFSIPVPKQEKYNYLSVIDAQLTETGELKVFTINQLKNIHSDNSIGMYVNGSSQDEVHIYTLDLDHQQLIDDETINVLEEDLDDLSVDLFKVRSPVNTRPKEYVVFNHSTSKIGFSEDGYVVEDQFIGGNLIAYHVDSGEHKLLQLADALERDFEPVLHDDTTVYLIRYEPNKYEVVKYNIDTETIQEKLIFPFVAEGNGDHPNIKVTEERIYLVSSLKTDHEEAYIRIGDLNSGEWVYEGKISLDHQNHMEKTYELNLYNVEVNTMHENWLRN